MLSDEDIQAYLKTPKKFAVVGASTNPEKPGNYVPAFLKKRGFKIIPVNPFADEILGIETLDDLKDLESPVDGVIIYRNPEAATKEAKKAVDEGIPLVWLPLGVTSEKAKQYAEENNTGFVQDRCPKQRIEEYLRRGIYED